MKIEKNILPIIMIGIFVSSFALNPLVNAEPNDPEFEVAKDITGSALDSDENIIITAITENQNLVIVKYSLAGTLIWTEELVNDQKVLDSVLQIIGGNSIVILRQFDTSVFLSIFASTGELQYDGEVDSIFLELLRVQENSRKDSVPQFVEFDSKGNLILLLESVSTFILYKISTSSESIGERIWKKELIGITLDRTFIGFDPHVSIGIDSEDNIILLGWTTDDDIPYITPNAYKSTKEEIQNSFLIKLSPEADLIWGTYYPQNAQFVGDVLIDDNDGIIMVGTSNVKFDKDGNFIWNDNFGSGGLILRILDKDNTLVTISDILPENDELWVSSFDSTLIERARRQQTGLINYDINGGVVFNTYLGSRTPGLNPAGNGEAEHLIELSNSNLVIAGFSQETEVTQNDFLSTTSNAIQTTNNGGIDSYLTILRKDGSAVLSRYIGGNGFDIVHNIQEDHDGNLILIGTTTSTDFPTTGSSNNQGLQDYFIMKFNTKGTLLWSNTFGAEGSEQLNGYSLLIPKEGKIVLIGTTSSEQLSDNIGKNSVFQTKLGFIALTSEEGELEWTIAIGDTKEERPDEIDSTIFAIILVAIVLLSGLTYLSKVLIFNKGIKGLNFPGNIEKIISPILVNKPELLYLFTGTTLLDDDNRGKETTNEIPIAIFDFKEFLHPIRLAIIKLLYENTRIEATEVVKLIGIGKKDVYNHIRTLKNKGFIHSETNFVHGNMKTVIQLEPATVKKFQELSSLLVNFLTLAPNMDQYLSQAIEIREKNKDNLYPDNN